MGRRNKRPWSPYEHQDRPSARRSGPRRLLGNRPRFRFSALFRNEGEKSLHLRRDFWHTIQELAVDRYLHTLGANRIVLHGYALLNYLLSQPAKDYAPVEARYPAIGNKIPRPREKDLAKEPLPSGLLGPVTLR